MTRVLWQSKWGFVRLVIAATLLWAFAADSGARLARLQLAAMPGYDFIGAATALQSEGRYGEALQILDAGLDDSACQPSRASKVGAADHASASSKSTGVGADTASSGTASGDCTAMLALRDQITQEQASWLRKAKDAGIGAITGQGQSLERLIGAVTADFFLIGDVRDLVIQSAKQLIDGDSDELILLLSAAGVVTTLAPEIDWAPSVLKAARKAGALSTKMGEHLVALLKGGKKAEAAAVMGDVATLSKRASPGGAVRLMRHLDSPDELRTVAAFVERQPRGAFALASTGRAGVDTLIEQGAAADRLIVKAASKGERGAAFLKTPAARAMLRPHPLLGIAKGFAKGTIPTLALRAIESMDAKAWWFIPLLAAWVFVEGAVIVGRFRARPSPYASE
jgi:hypothetical protein